MTEKISKAITLSRFPLIFLVIVLHSYFAEIDYSHYPVFSNITCLLSFVITRVAVPLFFAISGYLFFNKVEIMNLKLYQFKLKKTREKFIDSLYFMECFICLGLFFYY